MERIFKIKEICEYLGLTPPTVRKLINDGKLQKLKTNGAIRVSETMLKAYTQGK